MRRRDAERPLDACRWPPGLRAPGKTLARPRRPVDDRRRDQSCVGVPPILPTPFFSAHSGGIRRGPQYDPW
eukprot:6752750-Alexandrium_andersonii.AAC.1